MPDETIMVRGTESQLAAFEADLKAFLAEQRIAPVALVPAPAARAKRPLTARKELGHEPWLELAINIGQAVAASALTAAAKELVVAWIKRHVTERGLQSETKHDKRRT